jgi:hypothetical protein
MIPTLHQLAGLCECDSRFVSDVHHLQALAIAEANHSAAAADIDAVPHEGPLSTPDIVNDRRQNLACRT